MNLLSQETVSFIQEMIVIHFPRLKIVTLIRLKVPQEKHILLKPEIQGQININLMY
jgi:hypothetical protein